MNKIVYTPQNGQSITLPLGRVHGVSREGPCLDICLERDVAGDCPLLVQILIRTNGDIVLWGTEWHAPKEANAYWHFGALAPGAAHPDRAPTIDQLKTLERMFLGLIEMRPGLGTALGQPVAEWAFAGRTPADVAAKYGVAPPIMNG